MHVSLNVNSRRLLECGKMYLHRNNIQQREGGQAMKDKQQCRRTIRENVDDNANGDYLKNKVFFPKWEQRKAVNTKANTRQIKRFTPPTLGWKRKFSFYTIVHPVNTCRIKVLSLSHQIFYSRSKTIFSVVCWRSMKTFLLFASDHADDGIE